MKKNNLQEHHEETFGKDESYETFVNEIKSMAEGIMQLSLQAVQIYTPIVNRIISDTSATQHEVEYLMDFMLSLCYTKEFTNLFKNSVEESFPVSLIQFIAMQNIILKNMKMILKVLLSMKNS